MQKYHNYTKWEEYQNGMWGKAQPQDESQLLQKAIEFTGNSKLYGEWMMKVLDAWPISCEQNLTNLAVNRKAWIGHAACSLAFKCPEYIVREAWGHLTKTQQDTANAVALLAIAEFEKRHAKEKQLTLWSGND